MKASDLHFRIFFDALPSSPGRQSFVQHELTGVQRFFSPGGDRSMDAEISALSTSILAADAVPLPVAAQAGRSHLPAFERRQTERMIACAIEFIEKHFPLMADEILAAEPYEATYLLSDFEGIQAGTGVIRRRTNLATVSFLFLDTRANAQDGARSVDVSEQIQDPAYERWRIDEAAALGEGSAGDPAAWEAHQGRVEDFLQSHTLAAEAPLTIRDMVLVPIHAR